MSDVEPMVDEGASMAGSLVSATALFALATGLEQQRLEAVSGRSIPDLIAPDTRMPATIVPRIWQALLEAAPRSGLPLDMAAAAPLDYFGPLAFGARYASSLREALDNFIRYRKILSDDLECGLREGEESAALWFRHPLDALDSGAGAEVGLVLGARFVREVLELPGALVGVSISHEPLGPEAAYAEALAVPVEFGARENALMFGPAALGHKPAMGNSKLFTHIVARLDKLHAELPEHDPLAEVRRAIRHNAARSEYGAEALAKQLGVSLRVLQRQVAAENTTVRGLLDGAREANGRELLGDRRLSVEEVAYLLGYSDERAFRRSFKRLTGMTPAQFRKRQASA